MTGMALYTTHPLNLFTLFVYVYFHDTQVIYSKPKVRALLLVNFTVTFRGLKSLADFHVPTSLLYWIERQVQGYTMQYAV